MSAIDPAKVAEVVRCRFGSRPLTLSAFHDDIEQFLPGLPGPERLAVFGQLPERLQDIAWTQLRWRWC